MIRWLIAGALVAGLAIGVWALWPEDGPPPSTTTIAAIDTSTSSSTATTSTESSSTTLAPQVVTTTEEAEAILAEVWFGWFEGIYNQDEARIREVVGSQAMLDSALAAYDRLTFLAEPTPNGVEFDETEILLATEDCLVTWSRTRAPYLETTEAREGVDVLRWIDDSWLFVSSWVHRGDLWEADCTAEFQPLS